MQQKYRVMIAGPTTLSAILIAMTGFARVLGSSSWTGVECPISLQGVGYDEASAYRARERSNRFADGMRDRATNP
jgi:hypothetical protein